MNPIRFGPKSVTALTQRNLSRIREEMRTVEEQALTGRSVNKPSDAPTRRTEIDRLRAGIADQENYSVNATRANLLITTADQTLDRVGNVLKRASEITVQMSNGIHTASARANAALEIQEIAAQVLDFANTSVAGRFIFAGRNYKVPSFDATQNYQGTTNSPDTQIAANQRVETGWDGQSIFKGTTDIFDVLNRLATDLNANNETGIQAKLPELNKALDQIIEGRTAIGFKGRRISDALETADNTKLILAQGLQDAVGVNDIEVYTRLSELRTNYESALQITARSRGTRLFDLM